MTKTKNFTKFTNITHNYENINMEAFCEIFYYCYDLIYSSEFALESLNDIAYEMLEDMKYSY